MTRHVSLKPAPWDAPPFIQRAFAGELHPRDGVYMARAILQLCDELAELRERVRRLEAERETPPG